MVVRVANTDDESPDDEKPPDSSLGSSSGSTRLHNSLTDVVQAYGRFRSRWYSTLVLLGILTCLLLALPFLIDLTLFGIAVGGGITVHTLILTLIWATAAQAWNITGGYAGQFSLGHAAFFGIGAYVPILLIEYAAVNPWIGLLVGGGFAMAYALVVGVLCFRFEVRGAYFVLATLAFAELLRYVFLNVSRLGGASGFVRPLPVEYNRDFGVTALQFANDLHYYYLILAFLLVVSLVSFVIRNSRYGIYLRAIREDERAARALGIPVFRLKLVSFLLSAFFTAWVGAFWGMYFSSIRPEVVFDLIVNIELLLPAVVGGIGTVLGPILGSLVVTPAAEIARQSTDLAGLDWIIYGVFLIVIALYSPRGVRSWPGRLVTLLGLRPRTKVSGTADDEGG